MSQMNWTATAAIMLALAVCIGAFGAHGLQARLDASARFADEIALLD